MRRVFKGLRRGTVLLTLLTILVSHAAMAGGVDRGRTVGDRFDRAKRVLIIVFSRIGWPPG